ncbi:hypothetical protein E2C01_003207 [Portunus trituberculatus]|uniref:Uncharacterized protein n=1 Tax=Portunus trituberculatus TaxID=210409 RepID=A0A5B7CMB6_PORTR|nr:hypothetical protein [Portunus trituberculatus]
MVRAKRFRIRAMMNPREFYQDIPIPEVMQGGLYSALLYDNISQKHILATSIRASRIPTSFPAIL